MIFCLGTGDSSPRSGAPLRRQRGLHRMVTDRRCLAFGRPRLPDGWKSPRVTTRRVMWPRWTPAPPKQGPLTGHVQRRASQRRAGPRASSANLLAVQTDKCLKNNGGPARNRTGVHGFAIRCVTTPPPGHPGSTQLALAKRGVRYRSGSEVATVSCILPRRATMFDGLMRDHFVRAVAAMGARPVVYSLSAFPKVRQPAQTTAQCPDALLLRKLCEAPPVGPFAGAKSEPQ